MKINPEDNPHENHRKRMKKRFINSGLSDFEDHENIELLLYYAYPRINTNEIAHKMLNEFGSLHNLLDASPAEIQSRCKVTENVAVLVSLPILMYAPYFASKTKDKRDLGMIYEAGEFCVDLLSSEKVECFYMICLNTQRRLLKAHRLVEGSLASANLATREIIEAAIQFKAVSVVLTHNHPAGTLAPSKEDSESTKKIITALEYVNVSVIDHIIVGNGKYYSFLENNVVFSKKKRNY